MSLSPPPTHHETFRVSRIDFTGGRTCVSVILLLPPVFILCCAIIGFHLVFGAGNAREDSVLRGGGGQFCENTLTSGAPLLVVFVHGIMRY